MKQSREVISKRKQIEQINRNTLIIGCVGIIVIAFCLLGTKALISQAAYQNRVVSAKKDTLKTLNANIEARDKLVVAYEAFVGTPQNVMGGLSAGTGERDGDNAKIILDALPSKYDFPALTASLEKLATSQGLTIEQMIGADEEIAQNSQEVSTNPQPVEMAFEVTVNGAYRQIEGLTNAFQNSIRPIQIKSMSVTGAQNGVSAKYTGLTYYQPAKELRVTKEVIK